ncbi:MAG: hypothetical protein GXP44_02250 [bacterium]|nr:hypothetical protein [bacterium]
MSCDESKAYFGVYWDAIYAMDESGGIVWSNTSGSGTHSTDGVSVNPVTGIVYEVMDNTIIRFDAQTGYVILP